MTADCGDRVECVCFSPSGALLAAAVGSDVQILKAATGELATTLEGHSADVLCCAWSKDGNLLATGSDVRTARFYFCPLAHRPIK